jgi:hypothetical protein
MDPRSTRALPLWFGVLAPPLAWLAHLLLGDLLYELGCAAGMRTKAILGLRLDAWAVIQTAALLSITIAAGMLAFRAWRQLQAQSNGGSLDRAKAMALVGVASSALYTLILLFGLLPSMFLPECLPR